MNFIFCNEDGKILPFTEEDFTVSSEHEKILKFSGKHFGPTWWKMVEVKGPMREFLTQEENYYITIKPVSSPKPMIPEVAYKIQY